MLTPAPLSVVRDACVTLVSLAAYAAATAVVLALALGDEVRARLGLAPKRPVKVEVEELWLDSMRTLLCPFAAATVGDELGLAVLDAVDVALGSIG